MTTLTIDLPPDVYARLRATAQQEQKPVEEVARAALVARWSQSRSAPDAPAPAGERERLIAVLQQANLLAESGPELKARAARSTLTLAEARAILDRATDTPLSEDIIAMRGPKA